MHADSAFGLIYVTVFCDQDSVWTFCGSVFSVSDVKFKSVLRYCIFITFQLLYTDGKLKLTGLIC